MVRPRMSSLSRGVIKLLFKAKMISWVYWSPTFSRYLIFVANSSVSPRLAMLSLNNLAVLGQIFMYYK
jgi:hypothetical protein